jgi:hypothetical protein
VKAMIDNQKFQQRLEVLYQLYRQLEEESGSTDSYTKEQIDSFLSEKADVSDLSDFYTKSETDTKIRSAFNVLSKEQYEALETKTEPIYFIYE